jgi:myo-inositol-1(or 4)-monophosphatase
LKILPPTVTIRAMDEILSFAIHCAKESGHIQREHYQKQLHIRYKGEINIVTDVDMACQERIVSLIQSAYPGDVIISEEKENFFSLPGNRWIVDPLDGTTNYAHGYPFFCTSVAYEIDNEVRVGVVYNPIFDELFYALKGRGAFLNGESVRVSSVSLVKRALLSTGFPYDLPTNPRNNVAYFLQFLHEAQAIRRDGSAALNLSYVACGRFDGHWELRLNPWDVAAGALIVREAGGTVTDLEGKAFDMFRGDILASNGLIHSRMAGILKEAEAT